MGNVLHDLFEFTRNSDYLYLGPPVYSGKVAATSLVRVVWTLNVQVCPWGKKLWSNVSPPLGNFFAENNRISTLESGAGCTQDHRCPFEQDSVLDSCSTRKLEESSQQRKAFAEVWHAYKSAIYMVSTARGGSYLSMCAAMCASVSKILTISRKEETFCSWLWFYS